MIKRIIIWVLVIAFAYFFFSTIAKTCNNKVGDVAGSAASTIGDATQAGKNKVKEIASFEDDNGDTDYDIDDENDRANRTNTSLDEEDRKYDDDLDDEDATANKYDDADDELDEDAINAKLKAVSSGKLSKTATSYDNEDDDELDEEKISNKKTSHSSSKSSSSNSRDNDSDFSSDKKYLVVAGSYKEKKNAQAMVNKLKGMGYDDAELFTFDFAEYYSVTAGRYASRSSADATAKKLKVKGIDCYAHQMRSKYFD